jgi:hypothetical protein
MKKEISRVGAFTFLISSQFPSFTAEVRYAAFSGTRVESNKCYHTERVIDQTVEELQKVASSMWCDWQQNIMKFQRGDDLKHERQVAMLAHVTIALHFVSSA